MGPAATATDRRWPSVGSMAGTSAPRWFGRAGALRLTRTTGAAPTAPGRRAPRPGACSAHHVLEQSIRACLCPGATGRVGRFACRRDRDQGRRRAARRCRPAACAARPSKGDVGRPGSRGGQRRVDAWRGRTLYLARPPRRLSPPRRPMMPRPLPFGPPWLRIDCPSSRAHPTPCRPRPFGESRIRVLAARGCPPSKLRLRGCLAPALMSYHGC